MTLKLPARRFAGYIFDCDGTLADSMPLHYHAWRYAFEKHKAKFRFTWELFYSMAGTGLHDSVRLLNERYDDTLEPLAVARDQALYLAEHHHTMEPVYDVEALARQLHGRGERIAVASGGSREQVEKTLEVCGLSDLFEVVVTQDDVERSKPAPDLFLLAAELLGVKPADCLVFEDSMLGIQAADTAGMASVYIEPADPDKIEGVLREPNPAQGA